MGYAIVGSIASSVHGVPRATLDVDILAALDRDSVDAIVDRLEPGFYVDRETARAAVRARRSFNVIHDDTVVKADVYVPASALARRELAAHSASRRRRRARTVVEGRGEFRLHATILSSADPSRACVRAGSRWRGRSGSAYRPCRPRSR